MTPTSTWCDACSGYHAAVSEDGHTVCGNCGAELVAPRDETSVGDGAPWHFWLVVFLLALYLGWWLVRGILWLIG